MSDAPAIDRDQEMLCDLAERAYALACKIQDQAMAAEAPETISRLTGDFHRAARCVRQTIGLKAQLKRDAEPAGEAKGEIETRRGQVAATVRRMIGERHVGHQARALHEKLDARLDEEVLYDRFTDESVDAHIARICGELGLAKPAKIPPPCRPPMRPERQARIDELLSRIPDETDEDAAAPDPAAAVPRDHWRTDGYG